MSKISIISGILFFCVYSYSQYINDTLNVELNRIDSIAVDSTKLHQLYPNPFSPTNRFTIEISEKSKYKFTLFDSAGNILADLFDTELEQGKYSISWNFTEFKNGYYFYRLSSGNYSDTKKFMIIR